MIGRLLVALLRGLVGEALEEHELVRIFALQHLIGERVGFVPTHIGFSCSTSCLNSSRFSGLVRTFM